MCTLCMLCRVTPVRGHCLFQCRFLVLPRAPAVSLPRLREADFSKSGVSDADLYAFLEALPAGSLRVLRLTGCKNLKHDFGAALDSTGTPPTSPGPVLPSLSHLRHADFSYTNVDGHFVTAFLRHVPNLAELALEFCYNLHTLTVTHPKLKV